MRRYQRLVLFILFVTAAAWFALPLFFTKAQTWLAHLQVADEHSISASATGSLVYPVKPQQWLKFALPEGSSQLRILTNAHIQATDVMAQDPNWTYIVHYELLDNRNTVLMTGAYHQHSHLTAYKDAQGKLLYRNYYANKKLIPLDGRLILLGLQALKKAAFLRVSLETISPAIRETAVRVYVPTKISENQIKTMWLRMSHAQKDNLAENSIYPASLLSTTEKTNLLKHQWQPLGPEGIEHKHYQTVTLYSLKDKEIDTVAFTSILGLQADSQHYATLPLPEQGGQVALHFKALDGSPLNAPVLVNLQWFGRSKAQRWQQNAVWTNNTGELNYALGGGLLVIRPSSSVIVHAYLTTDDQAKHDISDAQLSIKSYLSNAGVDFELLHYRQQTAALRVDVRRLLNATRPQHERVRYLGFNAQNQIMVSGELDALEQASLFDRVGSISEMSNVSEPMSYFFQLPAQVTRLQLTSDIPNLLVSAYNQASGQTKIQRIPEDAYVTNDKQDLQLAWFPLRAKNDAALTQRQAVQWLIGQYHPPEDSPDILAGQYLWQDYMPLAPAAARYLLTDYTGEQARDEALANVYCALAVNRDTPVKLAAFRGLRSVSPELIFLRDSSSPFTVALFAGQEKLLTQTTMGQQGMIHAPELALGEQHLRLTTNSGGRWLMNYQANCTGEQLLKRRVFALTADAALDFDVQHSGEDELLSARLYTPTANLERSQIKVDIEPLNNTAPKAAVTTRWTYTKRLYDIRPLPSKAMPILYTQGQTLSNGEAFFIPLNSDLAAGTYRIHVALVKGTGAYLTLAQIKAGIHKQRRFYRETEGAKP